MNEIPDPHDKTLSKTQRKQASQALLKLGKDLAGLPSKVFNSLQLDPGLREELERLRKMTSHVARKRQMLFVGKLLRRADPEPLFKALALYQQQGRDQTARQHRVEQWRAYLLQHGDTALNELIATDTQIDRQVARQLIRQALSEASRERPPVASKKLFRLLHSIDLLQALPIAPQLP